MKRIALNALLFFLALTCSVQAEPVYEYRQTDVGVGASTPGVVVFRVRVDRWYDGVTLGSEHEIGTACLVARHPGYPTNNYTPSDYIVTKYTVHARANTSSDWLETVAGAAIDSVGHIKSHEGIDAEQLNGLYGTDDFMNMSREAPRYINFQPLAQACVDGGFAAVSDVLK